MNSLPQNLVSMRISFVVDIDASQKQKTQKISKLKGIDSTGHELFLAIFYSKADVVP
jgi:hypothetical protein